MLALVMAFLFLCRPCLVCISFFRARPLSFLPLYVCCLTEGLAPEVLRYSPTPALSAGAGRLFLTCLVVMMDDRYSGLFWSEVNVCSRILLTIVFSLLHVANYTRTDADTQTL